MNIVVLDGYAANPGDLCWDELQALGECTIYDRTAPAEVLERAAGAEILLTNKTVLTAEHMAALPELKYIGVLATGYNIVDTTAAKERGIIVTNIPAYSTDSVAQMVFAHILNITQQVQHHSEEVHRGRWTASKDFCFWDTPLIELREKKLGIVGLGHTGFTTARTAPAEVLERAAGAEILLTNKTVLTAEHMAALPELKYIGVLATGYNIVDTTAAKERGIIVTNIPAYSTDSVAQMVFAHILNITQQVQHHSEEVHRGRWTASKDFCFWDTPLIELREKKLGIVGLGHTGFTTARIAIGFGMKVCAYTSKTNFQLPPEIRKMELDELFRECDIISLHCPLTDSTREMVNAERLRLMKPTAILINTGRGPLINEQDLADALNNGTIYAAGVDVLSQEPPRADNPLLSARNCYITPHIAWASTAARERLMQIMLENIKAYQDGKPVNVVNK